VTFIATSGADSVTGMQRPVATSQFEP